MKTLKKLTQKYPVLKSRYLHLKAYRAYLCGSDRAARNGIAAAISIANVAGLKLEAAWATRSKEEWCGDSATLATTQAFETTPLFIFR